MKCRCWLVMAELSILVGLSGCGRAQPENKGDANQPAAVNKTSDATSTVDAKPQPTQPTRPTIMRSLELAKVLDFTKLPMIEGTQRGPGGSAGYELAVPGTVPDVANFYLKNLTDLGWKLGDDASAKNISDEYASLSLVKDDHTAYVSVVKTAPDKELMVSLRYHGNFNARTLPRSAGAKELYSSQTMSMYVSDAKVPDETDWVAKAMTEAGWHAYRSFREGASDPSKADEQRFLKFIKQGYAVNVMVGVAPAQGNRTSVHYHVVALSHELPVPPKPRKLRYNDEKWKLECEVDAPMAEIVEFYQKEMLAAGYEALKGETPNEKYVNLRFGTPGKDVVMVQVAKLGDAGSKVLIFGIPAAVMEKLNKDDASPSLSNRPPTSPRTAVRAGELPERFAHGPLSVGFHSPHRLGTEPKSHGADGEGAHDR